MEIRETNRLAGTLLSILFATAAVGDPTGSDLIVGSWDPGSAAFYELPITVKPGAVTLGKCQPVPYVILRDRAGHGPGPSIGAAKNWREIALELKPGNPRQLKCLHWLVLDFSIPLELQAHADVALYNSRSDFEREADYAGWGVWGKLD